MLTEVGRVVALEADSLWVETRRQSTCGACAVKKGCGHGLMNQMASGKPSHVRVLLGQHSASDYALNDEVRIALPEQVVLRSSFVVYVLPLLSMLLLASVAGSFFPAVATDLATTLGAVLGFLLGIVMVRLHAWWHREDSSFQPQLVGRVTAATPDNIRLA